VITIKDALMFSPLRMPAFRAWADHLWNTGFYHGTKLAELLGASPGPGKAGDVDCVASADRLLTLAEQAGWIIRGKVELTPTRAALGRGHSGKGYPVDHGWEPNRANEALFDLVFPDMDPDTKAACAKQYRWPFAKTEPKGPQFMKIKIQKSALLPVLTACADVADPKSPQPAAACVVLTAKGDTFEARSTNYYQSIARTCAVDTAKPGAVMVNAKDVLARIDRLDEGEIAIEATDKQLVIKQAGARYTLGIFDAATAPVMSVVEPQGSEIGAAALAGILDRAAPAMGIVESQAATYGIGLATKGGKLWAKAMNGNVGAIVPVTFDGDLTALIPAPAVTHLRKVLKQVAGSARLGVVGSSLYVFADGLTYSTLLTGEAFPPLESAIPPREGKSVTANRKALIAAVKGVTVGGDAYARLRVRPCPEGIAFVSQTKDGADARRVVESDCDLTTVSMAADYLIKVLEFGAGEAITIWQKEGERVVGQKGRSGPMVVEEDGAIFVAMPLGYDHVDLAADAPEWS
jgi:DNA polymerase III sliding clamp (beta) subunit (PCNA family)